MINGSARVSKSESVHHIGPVHKGPDVNSNGKFTYLHLPDHEWHDSASNACWGYDDPRYDQSWSATRIELCAPTTPSWYYLCQPTNSAPHTMSPLVLYTDRTIDTPS